MNEKRLQEIALRKSELAKEVESADEKRLAEIETETAALEKEEAEIRKKMDIAARLKPVTAEPIRNTVEAEERAKTFAETKKTTISVEETRSAISKRATLVSGGTLATPTGVSGINDMNDGESSIIDMVYVENCEGMGSNKVAYVSAGMTASAQTEGSAINSGTASDPTFGYVEIQPTSLGVFSQISKQAKKQSPLQYEAKTRKLALQALRAKATAAIIAADLKSSTLVDEVTAALDGSSKGTVGATTLRDLVLSYGGDEYSGGQGVLFLNKTDLVALGDVRGTNEKKAVYEIIPDANPNTGIIKDGGLAVKYCICSALTACAGTSQSASAKQRTMVYGDPKNFELDLFSAYEVRVSEDFAFTSLMDTIVGDVEVGGKVKVSKGFVALTIAKTP